MRPRSTLALLVLGCLALGFTVAAVPATATAAVAAAPAQEPEEHAPVQEDDHAQDDHAEEGEHAAEPKPWYYWPSKWINFLALAGLLYWLLVVPPPAIQDIFSFPGLRVIFQDRGAAILAARALAAEQKQDAQQLLVDSEQRLTKIDEEVAALVADARRDAEREQGRAAEDGKAQAEKIREVAEREVRHQRVGAQRQLRGFVADLAVNMAEKNLSEHLTPEDQDRLIREYLSRLGRSMA